MKMRIKKILVIFLCLTVLIQNFPLAAFAAAEDNMCEHHTAHTAECGYVQAAAGSDCTHVHDSECGYAEAVAEVKCDCEAVDENGALIHTEGCSYVPPAAGSDCTHTHDGTCGYVEAVEEHECHFECSECSAAEITKPVQDSQETLLSDNPYDDFYEEIDKPNSDVDSDPFKSITIYFALNLVDGNDFPIASDYTVNGKSDTANNPVGAVTVTFEPDMTDEYSYWKDDAFTLIIPKIPGYVTPGTMTFDWYFNHLTQSEYLKAESGDKIASEKDIDGLDIGYYTYTIRLAPCTHEAHENGVCTVCGTNTATVQLTRGETVTYYTDLSSAAADINSTPNGTTAKVKLLGNITVANKVELSPSAMDLDLNGCTITYTGILSNDTMLGFVNTAATIRDSSTKKTGMINGSGLARVTLHNTSVKMLSGTLTGKEPVWLYSASTFTLTGGTIRAAGTGRGDACIHTYDSTTAAYIKGGTLEGAYGVHVEKGTVFVSGNPTFSVTSSEAFLKEDGIIDLTNMTDPDGFVTALNKDLAKPYDSILIPAGYRIYNGETMMENTAPQAYAFLTVKAHTDHTSTGDNAATCTEKAVCDICGLSYGPEPAGHSTNRDGDRFATCVEKAYCSVCDSEYGELASDNHDYEWFYDGTYHWQVCTCDESHVTEKCGSEFYHSYMMGDGGIIEVTQKCDDCGYSGEYAEVYLSGSSFTYTGEAINPHITKYPDSWMGEQNIIPGYSNNVNVTNSATLTLDRYSLTFAITPREITAPAFEGLKESYPHTGETVEPAFTLNDDLGNVIPADEYTVSYSDNTDVGTATITITDVSGGNYIVSGSAAFQIVEHIHEFTFTADGATITAVCANTDGGCPDTEQSVTLIAENTGYTGEIVNSVYFLNGIDGQTVTLHYTGTDYDSEDSPVNAGTYTVTMTVGGKRVSKSFTVAPMNIAYCNPVLQQNSFTYSGTAPALSVAAVNGSVGWTGLVQGTDFTLGAVAVNAGNHKLTVSGIGNYGGTVELDYTINPAPITITGADIKSVPYKPDGYELEVTGVTISGVVGNDFLVIGTDFTASAVLTGTNAVGSPSAVVTVTMINKNYLPTKAEVQTVVSITKADPTYTVPTGLTATYGETLTDVTLNTAAGDTPGTWTWVDSGDTPVGSVGSQTHKAVFTPTDINNYKIVSDVDITIQVSKANAILSWANAVESVEYTGSAAVITAPTVTLADDDTLVGAINYTYIGTSGGKEVSGSGLPTNAGTYEITASIAEQDNYFAAISTNKLTLIITSKQLTVTANALSKTYGDTDPELTYTATGLVGDDKLSGALTRDPGEDVNTYAITQGTLTAGENYTITYVGAEFTVNKRIVTITAKDQTITYGAAISNTEITSTGLIDGHSVTVTLIPSTSNITANGIITVSAAVITADDADATANYEISYAGGKLVIEPDTSRIDALTTENVTSANEADILAVQEMLENADSTKEEWTAIDEKCEALLDRINEVKEQQKALTDEAAAYDPDTVKSTDQTDLTELAEEIEALLDTENLTENERAALESLLEQVKGMLETIEGVAEDSKAATDTIDPLDPATVTFDDKDDLEQAIETIDQLLQGDHLTEDERKILENAKADAEALIERIEAAQEAPNTENTEKVEDITADNVKPEDKDALEDAKADLENTLTDYSGNYTEEEKKVIQDEIQRIDDAIEALENVNDVIEAIDQLPETVEPDDEEATEKILDAKEAYDELTDHEKSLVGEAAKKKLDDLVAAMTAYDIIKGDGGKWTKDSSSGLSFTANGPLSKFVGIEVDGKKVDAKYYDAKAGSTVITLKRSFLSRLSIGEHIITVIYTDGETSGIFKVMAASSVPSTGDDFDIILPCSMFIVSLTAMVVLIITSQKRKRTN